AGIVAGALALLVLIGYYLTQGATPAAPPPANAAPPRELTLRGHTGPLRSLCFTPDGRRLVSASGWPGKDKSVRIWDLSTEQELFRIEAPGMVGSMVLSADGRFALAGAAGALLYIDVETGEVRKRLKTTYAGCPSVCFAADGRHCYSAHQDGYARRWDLETGREIAKFRVVGKWARLVAELPDGCLLTADGGGIVQEWDVQAGTE